MNFLAVLVAFAVTTLLGWPAGRALTQGLRASRAFELAMSYLCGQLALYGAGLALSAVDVHWTPARLVAGGVAIVAVAALLGLRPVPLLVPPAPPLDRHSWPWIAPVAAAYGAVALRQLREPLWSNDAIAIWALRAKRIVHLGGLQGERLLDAAMAYTHPEYPLLWPITMATPFLGQSFDPWAAALLAPLLTALLVIAVIGELLHRGLPIPLASGLGVLLLAFAQLFGAFSVGLAELPLALALFVLAIATERQLEMPSRYGGLAIAIAATAAFSTKNEGLAAMAAVGLVLLRRGGWRMTLALAPALLPLALRIAGRAVGGSAIHAGFDPLGHSLADLPTRLALIGEALANRIWAAWPVALLAVGALALGFRRQSLVVGELALLMLGGFVAAWLATSFDLAWILETTVDRITAPLGVLVVYQAGRLLVDDKVQERS